MLTYSGKPYAPVRQGARHDVGPLDQPTRYNSVISLVEILTRLLKKSVTRRPAEEGEKAAILKTILSVARW